MPEALKKADEILQQAVQGITDLINMPALINLDFADVQTVMKDKGIAHIGIGEAKGDDKALQAVQQAVSSPLLETTIQGASHVIINISGDISLMDANDAASYVQEMTGEEANIIFGAFYDDSAVDTARITVIATGLDDATAKQPRVGEDVVQTKEVEKKETRTVQERVNYKPITPGYTPYTAAKTTSNVQKKDIQIPEFLKNKR